MTAPLCAESNSLARELHGLLRLADPAHWRSELEQAARDRLNTIRRHLATILERYQAPQNDQHLSRLYEMLQVLAGKLEEYRPRGKQSAAQIRNEWRRFQLRLQPVYATLAGRLQRLTIPVPDVRPTNYTRNLFHFLSGVFCLGLIQYGLSPSGIVWAAVGFALWCWAMELLRIRFRSVTRFYMRFMGRIAHPHEHHRVNASTWFATALALLALYCSLQVASVAVAVLCVADPIAALIGRRYGRTVIRAGRTLEGSSAFVVAGTLAAATVLWVWYPGLQWHLALLVALAASIGGAVMEIITVRIDDNLTIPLGAALGASLVLLALGCG